MSAPAGSVVQDFGMRGRGRRTVVVQASSLTGSAQVQENHGHASGGGVEQVRVALNKYTLRFTEADLEKRYQRAVWDRQRHIWQRSLFVSSLYQVAFYCADVVSGVPTAVSAPIRLGIGLMQLVFLVLMALKLVHPHQRLVLFDSVAYGLVTVALHMHHKPRLSQWDALFVQYGIAFYTLPKISPLQYLQGLLGSGIITASFLAWIVFVKPVGMAELLLSVFILVPSLYLFNHLAYAMEKAARERFVLRHRLDLANIRLAFDLEEQGSTPEALQQSLGFPVVAVPQTRAQRRVWARALLAWLLFTVAGWVSIPEPLRFVDQGTALVWFMHVSGFTLFLVIVTKQMRWLVVNAALGLTALWVMSMVTPESWGVFAANSVGYVVLAVAVVAAFGVFSGVVFLWSELVSFISGACFSYPWLRAQLEKDHPALLRVIRPERGHADAAQTAAVTSRPEERRRSRQQVGGVALPRPSPSPSSTDTIPPAKKSRKSRRGPSAPALAKPKHALPTPKHMDVNVCAFCRAAHVAFMVPACQAWQHTQQPEFGSLTNLPALTVPASTEGNAQVDHGEAWLPSTDHDCDFATGTVLSTAVTASTAGAGGDGRGDGGVHVASGGVGAALPMCTPYAMLHEQRTQLSLQLRDTANKLKATTAELSSLKVNASEASTRTADVVASHQQQAIAAKDEARRVQEQSDAAVAELVSSLNDSAHTIKELRRQLRAAHQQIEHLRAGAPG